VIWIYKEARNESKRGRAEYKVISFPYGLKFTELMGFGLLNALISAIMI
jgi:hypothetical protein